MLLIYTDHGPISINLLQYGLLIVKEFNFINIDVQGYELEVLKGARNTIESIDLILSEINKEEMYKGCAKVEDIDEFLAELGFQRIAHYWQLDGGTYGYGLYLKTSGKL